MPSEQMQHVTARLNAEAKKLKPRPSKTRVRGTVTRLLVDVADTSTSTNAKAKAKVMLRLGKFLKRAAYAGVLVAAFAAVYKTSSLSDIIRKYVKGTLTPPSPPPSSPPTIITRAKNGFGFVSEVHDATETVQWALGVLASSGAFVGRGVVGYMTWKGNPARRMRR